MSDKNKKSPLEEAKINFEEIQKFAQEEAANALKEQVAEKLSKLFEENLNEDTTINIDGSGNVEISTNGEVVGGGENQSAETIGLNPLDGETTLGDTDNIDTNDLGDSEEFIVSDEDDEINVGNEEDLEETIQNQNMEEMNKMTIEAEAAAASPVVPGAEVAPVPTDVVPGAEAGVTPVEEAPAMPELLSKLDTLINIMMQQQGGAPAAEAVPGAEAGTEQEFNVIDDEAGAPAPAGAPAAPAMEEEIEIEEFEGNADANFIDEMENQMLEIVDDNIEEPTVDETRGLGFTSKRTGDKALKLGTMKDEKGHHAPVTSLKENKAQNESKLDELIKENKGLKNEIISLQGERKDFEDAFVDLRTQFNEMQLFNGKLALVNKVLMNGGLTTEEKIKICEQFDSVQTYEEASKLFKNIIKENNIKVGDGKEKLKGASTNTTKPKSTSEPLYESEETRRLKKLAGIGKTEEDNY